MKTLNVDPSLLVQRLHRVAEIARKSFCARSRCGALLVREDLGGLVIGQGFNGPPLDDPRHARCGKTVPSQLKPKADRTCCVHAERRALSDALRGDSTLIVGSVLYFIRLDAEGHATASGESWCTACSKDALDLGVSGWVLWHADGPRWYRTSEYNDLSHEYDHRASTARPPAEGASGFGLRASGKGVPRP